MDGLAEAQFCVGIQYYCGTGVETNEQEALKWIEMAAQQDEPRALAFLGKCHRYGHLEYPKIPQKSITYFERIPSGISDCQYLLSLFYLSDHDPDNQSIGFDNLNAMDSPEEYDLYLLGMCYEYGFGVEIDEEVAFDYYSQFYNSGCDFAKYVFGRCCEEGIFVKADREEAMGLYEEAAESGTIIDAIVKLNQFPEDHIPMKIASCKWKS